MPVDAKGPPMTVPVSARSPAAPGTTKVLVVEDDPGVAAQLVRVLTRGGYAADRVATGAAPRPPGRRTARSRVARHGRRAGVPPAAAAIGGRDHRGHGVR